MIRFWGFLESPFADTFPPPPPLPPQESTSHRTGEPRIRTAKQPKPARTSSHSLSFALTCPADLLLDWSAASSSWGLPTHWPRGEVHHPSSPTRSSPLPLTRPAQHQAQDLRIAHPEGDQPLHRDPENPRHHWHGGLEQEGDPPAHRHDISGKVRSQPAHDSAGHPGVLLGRLGRPVRPVRLIVRVPRDRGPRGDPEREVSSDLSYPSLSPRPSE